MHAEYIHGRIGSAGFSFINWIVKMAENLGHENVRDILGVVLPIQLEINGKNFKCLVWGKYLKYLSDRKYTIESQ